MYWSVVILQLVQWSIPTMFKTCMLELIAMLLLAAHDLLAKTAALPSDH